MVYLSPFHLIIPTRLQPHILWPHTPPYMVVAVILKFLSLKYTLSTELNCVHIVKDNMWFIDLLNKWIYFQISFCSSCVHSCNMNRFKCFRYIYRCIFRDSSMLARSLSQHLFCLLFHHHTTVPVHRPSPVRAKNSEHGSHISVQVQSRLQTGLYLGT